MKVGKTKICYRAVSEWSLCLCCWGAKKYIDGSLKRVSIWDRSASYFRPGPHGFAHIQLQRPILTFCSSSLFNHKYLLFKLGTLSCRPTNNKLSQLNKLIVTNFTVLQFQMFGKLWEIFNATHAECDIKFPLLRAERWCWKAFGHISRLWFD